ncbi:MAG: LPS assembly lipoprotein LptE [Syntrophobacteraceae bacterium]|nr:LPS assembly lipoprotein LptE [Desulfobacteraceae bacterium]
MRNFILSAIVLLLTSACGYHFSGEGSGPVPGLRYVAIPVFENKTSEPDLGSIFAGDLRRAFIQKGPIQVVEQEAAEAVFWGSVTNIYTSAVAHRDVNHDVTSRVTLENRLYVTISIRCVDTRTGRVIWQDPSFTYYKVYSQVSNVSNPDPVVNFDNRRRALQYLSEEMAIRIHDRFLSNF